MNTLVPKESSMPKIAQGPLSPAESWILRSVPLDDWTTPTDAAPRLSRLAEVERMAEWAFLYLETLVEKGFVERRALTDGTPQYRLLGHAA